MSPTMDRDSSGTAPAERAGTAPEPLSTEVAVTGGFVHGVVLDEGDVRVYRGIPFAAPPVGALRWAPPQPVVRWRGSRDATDFGPICVQPAAPLELYTPKEHAQDEDCLTLNVWTAAETVTERRPVMVWIHGGGLILGTGADYDGTELSRKGAVVVTINYRLGPFGFFAHRALSAESPNGASGNQGFLDQIQALRWVRGNISAFGGDPNRVTIFGQSAGSLSVSALMVSPLATGLFHRAIGGSGSVLANGLPLRPSHRRRRSPWGPTAEELGGLLAEAIEAEGADVLASMRAIPREELLDVWAANPLLPDYFRLPVMDGYVFPSPPVEIFATGRHNDVPLLLGSNADEGTAIAGVFAPQALGSKAGYEQWVGTRLGGHAKRALELYPAATDADAFGAVANLVGDEISTWAMQAWGAAVESGAEPAYLYHFSRVPPGERSAALGAYHGAEIPYVFALSNALDGTPFTPADRRVSDAMSDAWVRFASTGDPNGPGLPEWQPFKESTGSYLEFGDQIRSGSGLRSEKVAFWRSYYDDGGLPPIAPAN